jgi:2-polyprenyl-3-methyl-5-hydroxy-6-metoxy-1,4-benzoquinol methylase
VVRIPRNRAGLSSGQPSRYQELIMNRQSGSVPGDKRFQFGKNWQPFLSIIDEERIIKAEKSLLDSLELETLEGLHFLDIGSGSGLFSLAAHRLGAVVHSFDFDRQSVECTRELRDSYAVN